MDHSLKSVYPIRPQKKNCTSETVVCLFNCKTYHTQDSGGAEEFWTRINNYTWEYRNFLIDMEFKQLPFHAHFAEGLHLGESDGNRSLSITRRITFCSFLGINFFVVRLIICAKVSVSDTKPAILEV